MTGKQIENQYRQSLGGSDARRMYMVMREFYSLPFLPWPPLS